MARKGLSRLWFRGRSVLNHRDGHRGQIAGNTRGDVSVVQALPPAAETVRLGQSFVLQTNTSGQPNQIYTAAPSLTTDVVIMLWNREPPTGKHYVIDAVGVNVTGATLGGGPTGCGIFLALRNFRADGTTPILSQISRINSLSGKDRGGGSITTRYIGQGIGTVEPLGTPLKIQATDWFRVGRYFFASAPPVTLNTEAYLGGRVIVPPGYLLGLAVAADTTDAQARGQGSIFWHEVQFPQGT